MIPVVDLRSPDAARQIDAALAGEGFLAISGHSVAPAVVAAAFDAGQRFFAMPEDVKARWHIDRWPLRRGFDPIGWQALDPTQPPDLKESFYLGEEHIGPNQWPELEGFRPAMDAYSAAMRTLAGRMIDLFAQALGLPTGYFDGWMRHPTCTTRLLHYPPNAAAALPGQIGCGAHTDWGAVTLLAQDDAGGLQVQRADGTWIDVVPVPGTFVVNAGDMTQRFTNDRWRSTMHRVVQGRERWSIAYFFDLDAEASVAPLPCCVSADHPARYGPLTAGEHLEAMYKKTTVTA